MEEKRTATSSRHAAQTKTESEDKRELTDRETIAAIATPPGRGGIGIIRISGSQAWKLADKITCGAAKRKKPRYAQRMRFYDIDSELIDDGLLIFFPAPFSYTGEDVIELQAHGGPFITRTLLLSSLAYGARQARPGEFTERAFLNGKLDLLQAEAVAQIINASSRAAAKAARNVMSGFFSQRVEQLNQDLLTLRSHVEAGLDFAEEELGEEHGELVTHLLKDLQSKFHILIHQAQTGQRMMAETTVVIAGRPNVGKSSLLNTLLEEDRAIVSPEAGTTRDVLRENMELGGIHLQLVDTAGIHQSGDPIEAEGIERARTQIRGADILIWVYEGNLMNDDLYRELIQLVEGEQKIIFLRNKSDLYGNPCTQQDVSFNRAAHTFLSVSVSEKRGLDALRQVLCEMVQKSGIAGDVFSAQIRHIQALQQALQYILQADNYYSAEHACQEEIFAEQLRAAQVEIETLTGKTVSDDLLGMIFSRFCIGK